MRNFSKFAVAIALLLVSTFAFAKNASVPAIHFSKQPFYSILNQKSTYSVTVHFGVGPSSDGNRTLYAYITDTDVPGFANRVAAPYNVTLNGYITIGSNTVYGQINIPGGQTYGSVNLGYVGTNSVTLSNVYLVDGNIIGGLPAYVNTSVGFVYP